MAEVRPGTATLTRPAPDRVWSTGRDLASGTWGGQARDLRLHQGSRTSAHADRGGAASCWPAILRRDRKMAKLLWKLPKNLRRRAGTRDIAEQGRWLGTVMREATSPTTPCPPRLRGPSQRSATMSIDLWRRALRRRSQKDRTSWTDMDRLANRYGCPSPGYPTPGPLNASASNTQGGSRMRECRRYGSVRGARSNARPYRD